jgi:hypothetical protein
LAFAKPDHHRRQRDDHRVAGRLPARQFAQAAADATVELHHEAGHDPRGGYTRGNIRVICWAANCLLSTWGDEVALDIARGIIGTAAGKAEDA